MTVQYTKDKLAALQEDLDKLHQELNANIGEADFRHLRKIENWGKLCSLGGYMTAWLAPNPVSAILISLGNTTRWTMMTHHISHKGYDKVTNIPTRYTSKYYAQGKRRWLDWFDWIIPQAWDLEHNYFHHYFTDEIYDPDLVEDNVKILRDANLPLPVKYAIIFFFMCHWKLSYYAPNTFWIMEQVKKRQKNQKIRDLILDDRNEKLFKRAKVFLPINKQGLTFWYKCLLPYGISRFLLIPFLFIPLQKTARFNVLINSILAEIITNIHTFCIIVPNHAGDDMYRFDTPVKNKAEFYFRQIVGSVNFSCGNDLTDFFHGWLNYQIEHHLWPDLPMLKYQEAQPKVEAICKKHNIPYVKENVFKRVKKLFQIMTGKISMARFG